MNSKSLPKYFKRFLLSFSPPLLPRFFKKNLFKKCFEFISTRKDFSRIILNLKKTSPIYSLCFLFLQEIKHLTSVSLLCSLLLTTSSCAFFSHKKQAKQANAKEESMRDISGGTRGEAIELLGAGAQKGFAKVRNVFQRLFFDEEAAEATERLMLGVESRKIRAILGELDEGEGVDWLRTLIRDEGSDSNVKMAVARVVTFSEGEEGMPLLKEMARDPDLGVRQAVAEGAAFRKGEEGMALLREMAKDTDPSVRQAVPEGAALLEGYEGIALLREMAKDPEPLVRAAVAKGLGSRRGEEEMALLREMAKDPDLSVKMAVLRSSDIGREEAMVLLREMAEDPNHRQKIAGTVRYLSREIEPRRALLREMAEDPDPSVKQAVFKAMIFQGGREEIALLRELAQDSDSRVRRSVAEAISSLKGEEAMDLLEELARDTAPHVREQVARSVKLISLSEEDLISLIKMLDDISNDTIKGIPEMMSNFRRRHNALLREMAEDPAPSVRQAVIEVYRKEDPETRMIRVVSAHGGEEGMALLRQMANDPEPQVRTEVVRTTGYHLFLDQLEEEEATALIKGMAKDTDPNVRQAVATQAEHFSGEERMNLLKEMAEDTDSEVRRSVVRSIDVNTKEGQTMLTHMSRDVDEYVRSDVDTAVKRIEEAFMRIGVSKIIKEQKYHFERGRTWPPHTMQ